MNLQEEYIKRHSLNIPLITYVSSGSILLRMEQSYILMTIKWREEQAHPGHYYINYFTPIHDGYNRFSYFHKIADVERELDWDEYQPFLYEWSKGQVHPVSGDLNVILAAWEIFVYCCDSWLVDYVTPGLEKLIYKSLDDQQTLENRFQGYQEALVAISTEYPYILKAYKQEILPHVANYCHWLAQLIESHGEKALS